MQNTETIYIWPNGEWLYYWESGWEMSDNYVELDVPVGLDDKQVNELIKNLINKKELLWNTTYS